MNTIMLAVAELSGWPLAVVICVIAISIASFYMGRWPWQK